MSRSSARDSRVGAEISGKSPVFALIPKTIMTTSLAEVFAGCSKETDTSRSGHSIERLFSIEKQDSDCDQLDYYNRNHDHTSSQTEPNGNPPFQKEAHLFSQDMGFAHQWPKFRDIHGRKNRNSSLRSRNGCCTKDDQPKNLLDSNWKPGNFLPRNGHAVERSHLKVHEQSYISNFPNYPGHLSHRTLDPKSSGYGYSSPIVMLPFLATPQSLIPAAPCAEQLSSFCGTCGSQNECATCSENIVAQMETTMCNDEHGQINHNIRSAINGGHLKKPNESPVSVFNLDTPLDSKIIETKPKREDLEYSSKLSTQMGELLTTKEVKECENIPDSVSDAASNYALDEVLSKYKDSAVNAENTVKQESTVTDKLDKILTTKWNIPSTSSLTNSIRNPSLALIRDKKGNISLEVQHDQRNICDKKLRDKVNDLTLS